MSRGWGRGWGCSHCQRLWEESGAGLVARAQAGEIRLVFRPIFRTKSELLITGLMCCQSPEKGFEQIGEYFALSQVAELALRNKEDLKPLLGCVNSAQTQSKLAFDGQAPSRWEIQYTPTLFLDGKRVPPEKVREVLQQWARG